MTFRLILDPLTSLSVLSISALFKVVLFYCFCRRCVVVTPEPNVTKSCPFPHWPPILPPIFAILLSILMIPCYCYACGPLSGPYWAEEREKVIVQEYYYNGRQQPYARPLAAGDYNNGARLRAMTNGYGRL